MAKTVTTPAMKYSPAYQDFCVCGYLWCCARPLGRRFRLSSLCGGDFIRLRFSRRKTANSSRLRFQLLGDRSGLGWTWGRSARPRGILMPKLECWLLKQFPSLKNGKAHALYVQVLPGKRGGKPYPVRKD